MRTARRVGRTVVLRLRFDDFSRATRSHTMPRATAESRTILGAARELLASLTLLGISVSSLDDERPVQLTLPLFRPGWTALDAALDEVRDRFGTAAIMRAVLLGRDQGISMPLLPD